MPQVEPRLVKERARRLRESSARHRAAWLRGLVGSRQQALVERDDGSAHCANFAPIRVTGGPAPGSLVTAIVTGVEGDLLVGEAA
jgi:threonylcarbamoyladenosine tRNA methylthiotransferase MtaB